jgi:hypothetical protein
MFDYNVSPYFQSFIEIKVEKSKKRLRLIPYSNNGRLTWGDITSSPSLIPAGTTGADPVEWIINFR